MSDARKDRGEHSRSPQPPHRRRRRRAWLLSHCSVHGDHHGLSIRTESHQEGPLRRILSEGRAQRGVIVPRRERLVHVVAAHRLGCTSQSVRSRCKVRRPRWWNLQRSDAAAACLPPSSLVVRAGLHLPVRLDNDPKDGLRRSCTARTILSAGLVGADSRHDAGSAAETLDSQRRFAHPRVTWSAML